MIMGSESNVETCKEDDHSFEHDSEVDAGFDNQPISEHTYPKKTCCCTLKRPLIKTICVGQILSIMLCSTGTAATALSTFYDVQVPCFNGFTTYSILALTFGLHTVQSSHFLSLLKKNGWKYLLVAILDVEANFLLTKAYSYTTLTSVQLCDSFTIPTVMIVSYIFLRVRYKILHYIAVIFCISGAVCLVLSDTGGVGNASNEVVGDVMALSAAFLYGVSQVGQEYLVKKYSWKEYLGMIGLVGFLISGIQTLAVEKENLSGISWNWEIALVFVAFAVCQTCYYTFMPYVMKMSSATVVNLSLLTSDFYTLIVGLFLFNYKFSYIYFIAFAAIFTGLVMYNLRPTPHAEAAAAETKSKVVRSKDGKVWTILMRNNNRIPLLNDESPSIQYTNL